MMEARYKIAEQQFSQKAAQLQRMKGSSDYQNLMNTFRMEMQKLQRMKAYIVHCQEAFRQQQAKAAQGGAVQGPGAGHPPTAGPSSEELS